MKTDHIIINGDSRKMKELEDESLHLVVTSPPYWQLKDYGSENQVGYNDSYENYINNLNLVWSQAHRILHKGCRLCVNIGDQFARAVYYGRYKVIPIRTEIIKFCESTGFDYMGAIIWQKKTTTNTTGGASLMGSYPTPRNGIISIDYEFILLFKKLGQPIPPDKELKEQSKMTKDEWKTYFSGHWNFGGAKQNGHIAMFPEELPKRLIKMFSFVGDTVLDPFLGSGTTTLAAKNLGRNSIGYEVNSEFIPFIKDKLSVDDTKMFDESNYTFKVQQNIYIDFEKEIEKLPYKFVDPHKFDKKIDPKKLQYGSKIDSNSGAREEYFIVKEIISPEIIKLSNNIIVRLIGVKKKKEINGKAIKFLERKTKGQKVYMKFDVDKYDSENHLLCYLYLKNKTFLNAHLIKEQLADVDDSFNYKYRNKFLNLVQYSNG
ncbi:MAG: thermonuclease family protein [Bacteroidetes bacterium]|nr:thermonuclease family protein [Bacteroidota bacterium]